MALPQTEGKRFQVIKEGPEFLVIDGPRRNVSTAGNVACRCYTESFAGHIVHLLNKAHDDRLARDEVSEREPGDLQ